MQHIWKRYLPNVAKSQRNSFQKHGPLISSTASADIITGVAEKRLGIDKLLMVKPEIKRIDDEVVVLVAVGDKRVLLHLLSSGGVSPDDGGA